MRATLAVAAMVEAAVLRLATGTVAAKVARMAVAEVAGMILTKVVLVITAAARLRMRG